uniref:Uncharacterized protein n=1 Tax=Solanum lycopersicum TaxID=4081 RepID=A0A3Q7F8B7_SOLLC
MYSELYANNNTILDYINLTNTDFKTAITIKKSGAFRESNSGPLAPKARIIPLDQMPCFEIHVLS